MCSAKGLAQRYRVGPCRGKRSLIHRVLTQSGRTHLSLPGATARTGEERKVLAQSCGHSLSPTVHSLKAVHRPSFPRPSARSQARLSHFYFLPNSLLPPAKFVLSHTLLSAQRGVVLLKFNLSRSVVQETHTANGATGTQPSGEACGWVRLDGAVEQQGEHTGLWELKELR